MGKISKRTIEALGVFVAFECGGPESEPWNPNTVCGLPPYSITANGPVCPGAFLASGYIPGGVQTVCNYPSSILTFENHGGGWIFVRWDNFGWECLPK